MGVDGGPGDSEVNCLCCGGRCLVPRSVVSKLNKLTARGGVYKFLGDFGLRENIYYGSIFVCMTLIVIVCFLVINNRSVIEWLQKARPFNIEWTSNSTADTLNHGGCSI